MEKEEYTITVVLGTALTCPQWGPDFHFVFLLYFPDYLPASKMFSLQYFLNSFSLLHCVFIMFLWFFFSLLPTMLFFWSQIFSCWKSTQILHWGLTARPVCTSQESGPRHCWLVPSRHLTGIFICSPLLSQLALLICPIMETTRATSIPGPHLPHLSRSLVWRHLFPSSAFR